MAGDRVSRSILGLAVALVVLGIVAYAVSGRESWTALIPAIFGLLIGAAGWSARNPARRSVASVVALVLALVGLAGSFRGLVSLPDLIRGAEVERPIAVVAQSIMAALCGAYVISEIFRRWLPANRKS
jgi:hypothetical protein